MLTTAMNRRTKNFTGGGHGGKTRRKSKEILSRGAEDARDAPLSASFASWREFFALFLILVYCGGWKVCNATKFVPPSLYAFIFKIFVSSYPVKIVSIIFQYVFTIFFYLVFFGIVFIPFLLQFTVFFF